MRPGAPALRTFLWLLAIPVLSIPLPGVLAQTQADVDVALRDNGDGTMRALFSVTATLVVEEDPDGTPYLRLPVPLPFTATHFAPFGQEARGTWSAENNTTGFAEATFRWHTDAPAAGTEVPEVLLEASHEVREHETVALIWFHHGLGSLNVHVDVPSSHEVTASKLTRQVHGTEPGRRVWTNPDFRDEALSLFMRPERPDQDPATAHPPWAGGGFAIVAGIAILSGGTWFLGKKLEARRKRGAS